MIQKSITEMKIYITKYHYYYYYYYHYFYYYY